jgi:hypothetical protein
MTRWLLDLFAFRDAPHTQLVSRLKAQPVETSPRVIYATPDHKVRMFVGKPMTLAEWEAKHGRRTA